MKINQISNQSFQARPIAKLLGTGIAATGGYGIYDGFKTLSAGSYENATGILFGSALMVFAGLGLMGVYEGCAKFIKLLKGR